MQENGHNSYRSIDERTLVQNCLRGVSSAQQELYQRFSGKMMGVCLRYARNSDDAKDLLQDGFIKTFGKLSQFSFDGSLEGWIRRIMVNTAINYLKKNKVIFAQVGVEERSDFIPQPANNDHQLAHTDVMRIIFDMPLHYRTVLNLYAVEGYSHKEVADILAQNESTCRSQYARAKALLQKKLEDSNIIYKEKVKEV
jgi:RNA polymerase sigma factor (sigma-70 family)